MSHLPPNDNNNYNNNNISTIEGSINLNIYIYIYLFIYFNSLLFRNASTSLVISRLGSLGVYQKAVYFYCCVVNVSLVKFTDFNFMIYEFDE